MRFAEKDVIDRATILAAAATLPDPCTSEFWTHEVDVVSRNGVELTLEFELEPRDDLHEIRGHWETVACFRR